MLQMQPYLLSNKILSLLTSFSLLTLFDRTLSSFLILMKASFNFGSRLSRSAFVLSSALSPSPIPFSSDSVFFLYSSSSDFISCLTLFLISSLISFIIAFSSSLSKSSSSSEKKWAKMSCDMRLPTMWHLDKCRLRRACAASCEA